MRAFKKERLVSRMIRLMREARKVDGHPMTQAELAAAITKATGKNTTQGRISKLESGATSVSSDAVEGVAAGLGLSVWEFYAEAVKLTKP